MNLIKTTRFLTSLVTLFSILTTIVVGQSNVAKSSVAKNTTTTFQTLPYIQDLTQLARDGQIAPAAGVEADLNKVMRVLAGTSKRNPVIIDEFSGKSHLVLNNLALDLQNADAPKNLRGKKVLSLNTGALLAAVQAGESVNAVFKQLTARKGVIIFVDDIGVFSNESVFGR